MEHEKNPLDVSWLGWAAVFTTVQTVFRRSRPRPGFSGGRSL
jgi:hypothetical protein